MPSKNPKKPRKSKGTPGWVLLSWSFYPSPFGKCFFQSTILEYVLISLVGTTMASIKVSKELALMAGWPSGRMVLKHKGSHYISLQKAQNKGD